MKRQQRTWKRDPNRDAFIVDANMRGLQLQVGTQLGMTPNALYFHSRWLKKQNAIYVDEVTQKVMALQDARSTYRKETEQDID